MQKKGFSQVVLESNLKTLKLHEVKKEKLAQSKALLSNYDKQVNAQIHSKISSLLSENN